MRAPKRRIRRWTAKGPSNPPVAAAVAARQGDEALISLQKRIAKLGYALRLKYLQAKGGDKPPQVFDAWLVDRDPRDRAGTSGPWLG